MKPTAVVDPVVGAAKLPFRTVAWSFGLLRGLVGSVIRIAAGDRGRAADETPAPVHVPVQEESVSPQVVLDFEPVEPAPQREPEAPREAFVNEPKAVSRESAHGAAGRGRDAEIDDWYGETEEDDAADSVVEALAMNDGNGPLVDEAAIKSVLSEAEILRRAAETDKG